MNIFKKLFNNKELTNEEKQIIEDYELISSEEIDRYFKKERKLWD